MLEAVRPYLTTESLSAAGGVVAVVCCALSWWMSIRTRNLLILMRELRDARSKEAIRATAPDLGGERPRPSRPILY